MIYHAETLGQLRDAIKDFIAVAGENARVGTPWKNAPNPQNEHIEPLVTLDLVYVDRTGCIMGDEADDYQRKSGEYPAVRIQ